MLFGASEGLEFHSGMQNLQPGTIYQNMIGQSIMEAHIGMLGKEKSEHHPYFST